ncbi:MAG: ParB N-terminal domain-containing protein [Burkholderiaceae bacterium]|nr:ParB N-terminal domain-containing protein [Polaromonas sp.]MDO8770891.1 ParB N-terminal domain-containing protein [Burkholderiaceae bacterium]
MATNANSKRKPVLGHIHRNTDQAAMSLALSDVRPPTPVPAPAAAPAAHSLPTAETDISALYAVGSKHPVPLFLLARSPNQARVFYSTDELDEMSKSLRTNGQDVAALGYVKSGRVFLIDGVKRFQGATIGGLGTLDVEIVPTPVDDAAEYEMSRRINLERSAQTALDDAVRWKDLLAKAVYADQDSLAQSLGISKATVSKTMGLNRIPERLLRTMSDHPQTRALTIAYEISNIFAADQFKDAPEKAEYMAEDVIEETAKLDLSRHQVGVLIASKLSGPKSRLRGEAHPVKYGESKGSLKVVPSRGQLELVFKGLPPLKVEELKALIEQMLAGQLSI